MTADRADRVPARPPGAPASSSTARRRLLRRLLISAIATLAGLAGLALPAPARAQALDLLRAFEAAQRHDAQLNSARQQLAAARERLPQALAASLPAVGATAAATAGRVDTDVLPNRSFDNVNGGINLSYPLYRPDNAALVDQTEIGVRLAQAQLGLAAQDLVSRVADAYFDVLSARDAIEVADAQRRAIAEQFEAAKRNFEVGTATVTDQQEAQARLDLNAAQLAAARNDLTLNIAALAQLTGLPVGALNTLKLEVPLPGAQPSNIDDWTARAREASFGVQQAELNAAIARRDIDRARYARRPVVDLVSQATLLKGSTGSTTASASLVDRTSTVSAGIQLTVPLYSGGGLQARERESVAALQAAESDLESVRRISEQSARQAFLGLKSSAEQAKALEAAVTSSRLALESNLLGYQVGVRINVDVLNAQQQLFSTLRDLSRARYDVLLNGLRLKAVVGDLQPGDVAALNALLSAPAERIFPAVTTPGAVRGAGAAPGAVRRGPAPREQQRR